MVAINAETKANDVIAVLNKIILKQRNLVKEITLDMAANMGLITKKCLSNAIQVTEILY